MGNILVDTEKCIGCGKCARMCMKDNIVIEDRKAKEAGKGCLGCGHCVSSCPKGAITLVRKNEGVLSNIKKQKIFDGAMVSGEDLEKLYSAMDRGTSSGKCQFFTLQGDELNSFIEDIWMILKEKSPGEPFVEEWAAWRKDVNKSGPNPLLGEGNQVLFIFSDSPESAFAASQRMIAEGFGLGIRGYHSNIIMAASKLDRNTVLSHFPASNRELQMAFVIGHGRRLIEPVFKPMNKLKGLFDKL